MRKKRTILPKKLQIHNLKRIAKKYKVPDDLIDWNSVIDGTLTYSENKRLILPTLKVLSRTETSEHNKDEEKELEKQMNLQQQEYLRQHFEEAIQKIKVSKNPKLEEYFKTIEELVKITVNGNNNSLALISDGGLGKTRQVLKNLAKLGLEVGIDYIYLNSYITPLELYHILHKNSDKLIVLDDVEKLLDDLKNIGILKGALWESAKGLRLITYYSTTEKLKAPLSFEFRGKVIMCMNKIPNKNQEIIESLLSRTIQYRIDFDYETKIKIMYEIAKEEKIPMKVVDFIKDNTNEAMLNLNFRTLIQTAMIYDYYREEDVNGKTWEVLAKDILLKQTHFELALILELIKRDLKVQQQIEIFKERTGLSRATYFRLKRKLVSKSQVSA